MRISNNIFNVLLSLTLGLMMIAAPQAQATSVVDNKEIDLYIEKTKASAEKLTLQMEKKTLFVASGLMGKKNLPFDFIRITQINPESRTAILNFFAGDVLVDEKELKFENLFATQIKDGEIRGYNVSFEWKQETLFTKSESMVVHLTLIDGQLQKARVQLLERYYALPMTVYNTAVAVDFVLPQ